MTFNFYCCQNCGRGVLRDVLSRRGSKMICYKCGAELTHKETYIETIKAAPRRRFIRDEYTDKGKWRYVDVTDL